MTAKRRIRRVLPRELGAIPAPEPIWVSSSAATMPDPWPTWEVRSFRGATAEARPVPCRRCGVPEVVNHTCNSGAGPDATGPAPDHPKETEQ